MKLRSSAVNERSLLAMEEEVIERWQGQEMNSPKSYGYFLIEF